MSRNKKPRKKYRPKPVALNAHEVAIGDSALLPQSLIDSLKRDMGIWLDQFARGESCATNLTNLADVGNVAEMLSELGICHDANSRAVIARGQEALAAVTDRRSDGGSWTLYASELMALKDLVTWHGIQVSQACHSEYVKAHAAVVRKREQAAHGNVAPGVRVLRLPAE